MGRVWLPALVDSVGGGARIIGPRPVVVNRGSLQIGSNFRIRSVVTRASIETGLGGTLIIGDSCFINQGTCIFAAREIRIGNRVDIGDAVRIYDTSFHPTRPGETTRVAPVIVEDDVWIASGAVILPGVTIGRASVIGAGAIVTKSVPEGSVVLGRPAETVSSFEVPSDYARRTVGD